MWTKSIRGICSNRFVTDWKKEEEKSDQQKIMRERERERGERERVSVKEIGRE